MNVIRCEPSPAPKTLTALAKRANERAPYVEDAVKIALACFYGRQNSPTPAVVRVPRGADRFAAVLAATKKHKPKAPKPGPTPAKPRAPKGAVKKAPTKANKVAKKAPKKESIPFVHVPAPKDSKPITSWED